MMMKVFGSIEFEIKRVESGPATSRVAPNGRTDERTERDKPASFGHKYFGAAVSKFQLDDGLIE